RAVEAATALAIFDAGGVERAADDVVLHRRKIGHRAALDEDDGVLLKVVADARDVGGDLHPVGQAHAGDLSQRRVRLLRGHRTDDRADAALLGRATTQLGVATLERVPGGAQGRRIHLLLLRLPPATDQLRDRWHVDSFVTSLMGTRTRQRGFLTDVRLGPQPTEEPTLAGAVLRRSAAACTKSRTGRCAK